jgi:hypothetical protein
LPPGKTSRPIPWCRSGSLVLEQHPRVARRAMPNLFKRCAGVQCSSIDTIAMTIRIIARPMTRPPTAKARCEMRTNLTSWLVLIAAQWAGFRLDSTNFLAGDDRSSGGPGARTWPITLVRYYGGTGSAVAAPPSQLRLGPFCRSTISNRCRSKARRLASKARSVDTGTSVARPF